MGCDNEKVYDAAVVCRILFYIGKNLRPSNVHCDVDRFLGRRVVEDDLAEEEDADVRCTSFNCDPDASDCAGGC